MPWQPKKYGMLFYMSSILLYDAFDMTLPLTTNQHHDNITTAKTDGKIKT